MEDRRDTLRIRAWALAVDAFATAYIFERRARNLRVQTRVLTFSSLAAPLVVGAAVLSFGEDSWFVGPLVVAASVVVMTQLIAATWAVVADWPGQLSYATESAAANHSLADRFAKIGRDPPEADGDLSRSLDLLEVEDQGRREQDYRVGLRDRELRRGHRAALRVFQRPCSTCGEVPRSLEASECGICGDF